MPPKSLLFPLVWATSLTLACANTAPTVVIQSAAMRPGTTLMDVVYRVNDPDDATVKTRALAFVDGVRSFANVLKPATFVEGTAANVGNAITANANHTLTWDVGTDWNTDLGQVKFEILCRDVRGLLAFDWISIPAAGGHPALTISKDAPSDASVLDALFWQYADGDTGLTLENGTLRGNSNSGIFAGVTLANAVALQSYSAAYIFKRMNLDPASVSAVNYAETTARAELADVNKWHAVNRPYEGTSAVVAWGSNAYGESIVPSGLTGAIAISGGLDFSLAVESDGSVIGWGQNNYGKATPPPGLAGVTAVAAGFHHSLALRNDGTVVAWGYYQDGIDNQWKPMTVPVGLNGVIAISSGFFHSVALKGDGTVAAWGNSQNGETNVPVGLTGVIAIAAGGRHCLALKSNGTVVAWGWNVTGQATVPFGLGSVIGIAAGSDHSLALKANGTVVAWGYNGSGETTVPTGLAGLAGVIAVAAGNYHSVALKSDGTVVGWGWNDNGQTTIPFGLSGVTSISAGVKHNLALKAKTP